MSQTRVPCHGCKRTFTPSGLSQHLARSHDPSCRARYAIASTQSPTTFQTVVDPVLASNSRNENGEVAEATVLKRCMRDSLTCHFQAVLIPLTLHFPTHQSVQWQQTCMKTTTMKMLLGPSTANLKTPLTASTPRMLIFLKLYFKNLIP